MVLVGYWPLNESSGEALDHSGRENQGSVSSVQRPVTGILGREAYSFDGSSSFVEVSDSPEISLSGNELTMSFWMKTSTNNRGGLIRKNAVNNWQPVFEAEINKESSSGYLRFMNGDASYEHIVSTTSVSDGEIHHVAATFNNSSSTAKAFVDGREVDSWNWQAQNNDTSGNLQIGRMAQSDDSTINDTTAYYDGKLSELRLYNRPLTQSEVRYLYSVGKRGLHVSSRKSS